MLKIGKVDDEINRGRDSWLQHDYDMSRGPWCCDDRCPVPRSPWGSSIRDDDEQFELAEAITKRYEIPHETERHQRQSHWLVYTYFDETRNEHMQPNVHPAISFLQTDMEANLMSTTDEW